MKNLLFGLILLTCSSCGTQKDSYSIFLVRHAEKVLSDDHPRDPELTDCGHQRAQSLASFFEHTDIDAVYSSNYIRTRDTANPTATQKNTDVQIYDPKSLNEIRDLLLSKKENALVVGHSNSTGKLTNALLGKNISTLGMNEDEYNRIYQVVVQGNSKKLNYFQTAFKCPEK